MRSTLTGLVCVLGACAAAGAQVAFRGNADAARDEGAAAADAKVEEVNLDGVRIRQGAGPGGMVYIVGWDRVRAVLGEQESKALAFMPIAERAWRARTRVERSDWGAAEPLLEELFTTYRGHAGPTASAVAEGLLRCRLRRGAQAASVWPWLEWVRITETAGDAGADRTSWIGGHTSLAAVADDETMLAPALPPIWLAGPALDALAGSPDWDRYGRSADKTIKGTASVAADLAALYRATARFEAGDPTVVVPETMSQGAGVRLVRDIVVSRIGDEAARKGARSALLKRVNPDAREAREARESAPGTAPAGGSAGVERWVEAWCRVAIGRSLLREQDVSLRRQGVIELVHVPARFARQEPYLTGVALAEGAAALWEMNDAAEARVMLGELAAQFPWHPALQSGPVARIAGELKESGPGSGASSPAKGGQDGSPGAGTKR